MQLVDRIHRTGLPASTTNSAMACIRLFPPTTREVQFGRCETTLSICSASLPKERRQCGGRLLQTWNIERNACATRLFHVAVQHRSEPKNGTVSGNQHVSHCRTSAFMTALSQFEQGPRAHANYKMIPGTTPPPPSNSRPPASSAVVPGAWTARGNDARAVRGQAGRKQARGTRQQWSAP